MQRRKSAAALLILLGISLPLACQEHRSKWQVGTIMAVAEHPADDKDSGVRKYDVSLKVGKTMYVVLFVPPDGTDTITHRTGLDLLVSVGSKTIAFNNLLGHKMQVPILSRKSVTPST
ncbi:MAG TPA: hypothetical protein VG498_06350 [Terriglobales bacterium]|nr:hypothetical protein [Terriglobales bacterium]